MATKYEKMINCATRALNRLNDAAIKAGGQDVCVSVPDLESTDLYGVTSYQEVDEFITQLVIDWDAWRVALGINNAGEEHAEFPVTAIAMVSAHIPEGSLVKVDVNHLDLGLEYNTFRVINNQIMSGTSVYGRRLTMVPNRGSHY